MERLRTIGQVFDYTFANFDTWDHEHAGRKTNVTYLNKFIDIYGLTADIKDQPTHIKRDCEPNLIQSTSNFPLLA